MDVPTLALTWEDHNGLFLQADGLSCGLTPPCKHKDQLMSTVEIIFKNWESTIQPVCKKL